MVTLRDKVLAAERTLTLDVRIGGRRIVPANPTDAYGTPGVEAVRVTKNMSSPVPVCSLTLSRVSKWIELGMPVTVDVGYDNITKRIFTGTVQDRSPGLGQGTINCMGNLYPLFRTVQIPERSLASKTVKVGLEEVLAYVGITSNRSLTAPDGGWYTLAANAKLGRMPASQMVQYMLDIDGHKIFETGSGAVIIKVIDPRPATTAFRKYTTTEQPTARILSGSAREDPNHARTRIIFNGAVVTEGIVGAQTQRRIHIEASGGYNLVRPALPEGADIDAEISNPLVWTDAKGAQIVTRYRDEFTRIPRQVAIELAGDPELDYTQTFECDMPEIDVEGNWLIQGIVHDIQGASYRTQLDLRGGGEYGTSLGVDPVAIFFVSAVEREAMQGTVKTIATLDARNSFDPDGDFDDLTFAWTDNVITNPEINTFTGPVVSVILDDTAVDAAGGTWMPSLTVTDADGRTGTLQLSVPTQEGEEGVNVPAVSAAGDTQAMVSPDSGQSWRDQAPPGGVICTATAARSGDGQTAGVFYFGYSDGSIRITSDFNFGIAVVLAADPLNGQINHMWVDRNIPTNVWACTQTGRLLLSLTSGLTWFMFKDFPADASFAVGTSTVFVQARNDDDIARLDGTHFAAARDGAGTDQYKNLRYALGCFWRVRCESVSEMTGQLERSRDNCATWESLGPAPFLDSSGDWWGAHSYDFSSNGWLYVLYSTEDLGSGVVGSEPTLYRVQDPIAGATFVEILRDSTKQGSDFFKGERVTCHPTDPNIVAVHLNPFTNANHRYRYTNDATAVLPTWAANTPASSNASSGILLLDDGALISARSSVPRYSVDKGAVWVNGTDIDVGGSPSLVGTFDVVEVRGAPGSGVGFIYSYDGGSPLHIWITKDNGRTWRRIVNLATSWNTIFEMSYDANTDSLWWVSWPQTSTDSVWRVQNVSTLARDAGVVENMANDLRIGTGSGGAFPGNQDWYNVALRATTAPGGSYPLNRIATPVGSGVWVFGGRADHIETLVQYSVDLVNWTQPPINGELLADLLLGDPALMSSITVAEAASLELNELCIILKGAPMPAGKPSIYYTNDVFGTFAGGHAWRRAVGLDAGLWQGVYVVPDKILNKFYAAFRDQNVWETFDGVNWAKIANVMPPDTVPNHAIWIGNAGDIDASGVYLIAAENPLRTGGIYKSPDAFKTPVQEFRPQSPFSTWPNPARGMQIATGLPGQVGSPDKLVVTRISGSNAQVTVHEGPGRWTTPQSLVFARMDRVQHAQLLEPFCLTPTVWYCVMGYAQVGTHDDYGNNSGPYGTGSITRDAGKTWQAAPDLEPGFSTTLKGTVIQYVRDVRGWFWALAAVYPGAAERAQVRVYRSKDQGLTWEEFAGARTGPASGLMSAVPLRMAVHPTDPDTVSFWGNAANFSGFSTPLVGSRAFTVTTRDGGESWAVANSGSDSGQSARYIYYMEMDDRGTIYLMGTVGHSTRSRLMSSPDFGLNWTIHYENDALDSYMYNLFLQPNDGRVAFFQDIDTSLTVIENRFKLSTTRGVSIALVTLQQELETWLQQPVSGQELFRSCMTVNGNAMYFEVNIGNPSYPKKVIKFSPITPAGVWTDLTENYALAADTGMRNMAVVPSS